MPEIAPALPATPLVPMTSAAAPVAAIAADGSAQDFLGQLKAALKSLAGAVKAQPAGPQLGAAATAGAAVTEPAPLASDKPAAPKADEKPSDALPEILAALGFVVVPVTPEPVKPLVAAATTSDTPHVATPVASPGQAVASTLTESVAAAAQNDVHATPELQLPNELRATPLANVSETHLATAPSPQSTENKAPDSSTPPVPVDAPTMAPPDTRQTQPAPTASAPSPTLTTVIQPHVQTGGGAFQQGSHAEDGRRHHESAATASVTETSPTPTAAAIDQTLASATAATANTAAVPTNAQVHPGEVVAQIAHQADLYRLPGNKGVRINLHPEDLGGVQVTLRYAAGGSLELHINVEHATTGALVQAGWTELRDALATQGIGPERLVMSITGPSGANQLDFSSNGGGSNRPDSGLAAFTQGGDSASSQQRQDNGSGAENWRAGRGWSNGVDSPSASDDTPRSSSGVSASRIDYRV